MKVKNSEQELIESNKLFFKIFEENTIGMIFTDLETTKYLNVNQAFLENSGYTKEEVIGKTSLDLNLIEADFRNKHLADLKEKGDLKNIEMLIRKKNGETFWSLTSVQKMVFNEKNYALTTFIDISDRKKAETELAQLASIVESSDDAIISKSTEGVIESWNMGAEKMYGYTFKEAFGKHISFIIPTSYLKEEKEINEKIRINQTISHYETVRLRKNGEEFYISLSASPLKDQGENIIGISVIARDISERKKAEDSSKLKDAFLSLISHEIRTPLNAIMGFSDILAKRKLGEQEQKYVNIIKSAGNDLLKIVNDIIDMSKIEAGTMVFEANSFSVNEIFQSLNEMLTGKAQEKNLTLLFTCDKDVPDILNGDQSRLKQIITSITTNAINFTEKGTVKVRARVIKNEINNTLIEFSIADTGIGISMDKIKTIFERFRQIETHDNRKQGGMGLGLSIAKRLVDLQGGSMTVETELTKGSTFNFCIPYKN
ncbi:MAG: PAS domain S-box protein [Bacteroidia bacterium]|nr:PAS domain S-box protein [Bacteroidia bacterium]